MRIIISLLILGFSPFAIAQKKVALSAGGYHTCFLNDNQVKCWGNNHRGQTEVPYLSNPTAISLGQNHTCALDDSGAKCWGDNEYGQSSVPKLKNPKLIAAGGEATCAVDDDGITCWGKLKYHSKETNVTALATGESHACAIANNKAYCWGNGDRTRIPQIYSPKFIFAGDRYSCSADDQQLRCEDSRFVSPANPSRLDLSSVTAISGGVSSICVLDDVKGAHCYGLKSRVTVPYLKNPKLITAGYFHACALDDSGIKCWGDNALSQTDVPDVFGPSLEQPSMKLQTLDRSLAVLISGSSPTRALLFKNLLSFVLSNLKGKTNAPQMEHLSVDASRYILLSLLGPSILSGDSEYYLEKVIPTYKADLAQASLDLGANGLNEIYIDTPLVRKTALVTIQASLSASTEFLPIQQKQQLAESTKLLGTAMANPDRGNILAALDSIQRNQSILDSLKASGKTAFLPATIETAAIWLDKKVK